MAQAATVALEEGEYALVVGQDGERMSVRTEGAALPGDGDADLPIPAALVAALAERLLHDPEFHDEMLEWFAEHLNADDDEGAAGHG